MVLQFKRSLYVTAALLVSVFSNSAFTTAAVYATDHAPKNSSPDKVFVCKYVGTPFVNERLQEANNQEANNPISVSVSSTGGTAVGSYFADKQGQSYVLALDTRTGGGQEGEPSVSLCPAPRLPAEVAIPAAPQINDPCGLANAAYIVPANTDQITWELKGNGNIVANVAEGYVFTDGSSKVRFQAPADSGLLCEEEPLEDQVIALPAMPSINDPCGEDNASFIVPDNTAEVKWKFNAQGQLIAQAKNGYVFTDDTYKVNFGLVTDSNVACEDNNNGGNGGNTTCEAEGFDFRIAKFEFNNGTYTAEGDDAGIIVTDRSNGEGTTGSFESKLGARISGVIVKGSTDNKVTMYDSVLSGTFNNSGLENNGENTPAISNIQFCGNSGSGGQTPTPPTPTTPTTPTDKPDVASPSPLTGNGKSAPVSPAVMTTTETPAELPYTGPSENYMMLLTGAILSVLTYGAIYFAQGRRVLE